jgi:hypothetical protein
MGSFANSLHVKCDDAGRVAAAVRDILGGDGWSPTDEPLDEDTIQLGLPSSRRGVQISAPVGGWVSLLDSDLMGASLLAEALADQLDTDTFYFLVNDSDSWCYTLCRGGKQLDEFDSAGEGGMPEEVSEEQLVEFAESIETLQSMMADGSLQERVQAMQRDLIANMPPEIQAIEGRMKQGQATQDDLRRHQEWFAAALPQLQDEIGQKLGGIFKMATSAAPKPKTDKPKKKKSAKASKAAKKRLDHLRPLLASGVSDDDVQSVLSRQAVFAEETLAEFLPLVSIPAYYANLSYGYLPESTPAELAAHAIRFVHELRFESDEPFEMIQFPNGSST